MGFMFLVTSALLGYIYSPQLDSPPPRWVHFAHGLLLFLYQVCSSSFSSVFDIYLLLFCGRT
ncbi:choline/ethanolaminephosphotransferase 1 [Phtheirospermum japonicum]|uniref:Choline/ethanolaminephosphotransferase 1 n=1 Tax=Phtheirospermum japonicum TaxID=374723 RepID=A0A830D459_9LAMI|nr:choline/ethanolaminephosphotransferase 1 [Phtheirospermum japonicum]